MSHAPAQADDAAAPVQVRDALLEETDPMHNIHV